MCRWSFGYERGRNSGYRRLNKQRSVFPSDTALLKALYLATHKIAKKWTMPLRNWCRVLGEPLKISLIPLHCAPLHQADFQKEP